jgi:hypothetical protein
MGNQNGNSKDFKLGSVVTPAELAVLEDVKQRALPIGRKVSLFRRMQDSPNPTMRLGNHIEGWLKKALDCDENLLELPRLEIEGSIERAIKAGSSRSILEEAYYQTVLAVPVWNFLIGGYHEPKIIHTPAPGRDAELG